MLHRPETFGRKHSLVAHTVVRIISQFKAQTLSDRVGSGRFGSRVKGSDPVPSLSDDDDDADDDDIMMMVMMMVVVVMLVNAKLPYCTHVLHQSVHVAVSHGRTGSDVGVVAGQPLTISRHVLGEQQLAGRRILHRQTYTRNLTCIARNLQSSLMLQLQ